MIAFQSKKIEVAKFLEELKDFIDKPDFDIETDFILIEKPKPEDEEHSTPYTMIDLNYDVEDVIERLKELTIEEYSQTILDSKDVNPPLLFIFGKNIEGKFVYIKLKIKIKGDEGKNILCVSFHYARERMTFPFA